MNESSGVGTGGGKGGRSSGREGWRAALAKAPREALVEELRERDVLHQLAADPEGVTPARPAVTKKRTTAEQWALLAASEADLVKGLRATQKAIYGEDGRREVRDAAPEVQAVAGSVAALFDRRDVLEVGGRYQVKTRPFGQEYALAAGERFALQPCGAQGTAWVIDEHHMVTAGHCVPAGGVGELVCVFGFAMGADGEIPTTFEAAQVAFPSAVLSSRELGEGGDGDWAVLRFEEALPASPLRVRGDEVEVGEEVWMLGYPCGIPLKYAPGALVTQHKNDDRFHATLDAFAGNSGSPVFDADFAVVGILVRGGRDFAPRKHEGEPRRSMVYAETELGEEVMKLGRFVARRPAAPTVVVAPTPAQASGPMAVVNGPGAPAVQSRALPRRRATEPGIAPALDAHALLIQISKYAAPQRPLPEVHDAEDLAAVLRDPQLCHYPPDNVQVLAEGAATREAILGAVRKLAKAASAESTVFLYFSGHGGQRGQTTYLLPYDCDAATAESLGRTAISSHELALALDPLRAQKVLLVFDCCHAGGMQVPASKDAGGRDGEGSEAPPVWPGLTEEVKAELLRGRGWALYASSEAGQRSYVWEGARNGIFTRHLLDGLRGGRPSDDGYVRIFELFSYVVSQVQGEMPRQKPRFKCSVGDNFPIARHKGGAVGVVPRTEDGFLYHALLCHSRADARFVREELLPQMKRAGLRVATIHDVVEPGVEYVEGLERGLAQARRTLVVVSQAFLERNAKADGYADHTVMQSKARDIRSGRYSVVPIYLEDPEQLRGLPGWLDSLAGVRLGEAAASHFLEPSEEMGRLLTTLAGRLPTK